MGAQPAIGAATPRSIGYGAPMTLTSKQNRHLRSLAHHLKPTVLIGASRVTAGVLSKVEEELERHELIKVKLLDADKDEVSEAEAALVRRTGCAKVQTIGHTLILYRARREDPTISLPRA